jgi:hypothetical protein
VDAQVEQLAEWTEQYDARATAANPAGPEGSMAALE